MVDRLYVFDFAQQLKTVFDITNRVFGEFVEGFAGANNELANQFIAFGKNAAIGAAGIYGLILVVPQLTQLTGVVLEVAREFENLNRVVANIEGTQTRGAKSIQFMKGEVNRLSADLRSSYKNYTQLLAATNNTPLEGVDAKNIFTGIQSAATANALTPDDAHLTFLAASQMVNKNVISMEELRQQMGERLPSAFQTAARAMGLTTAELSKLVETGQLTAEEFMPKFAAQLAAESSGSIAGASKTAQAALNRFNNEILEVQAATGSALQPIQKFVLNASASGLSVIRENMQGITEAAKILGAMLVWSFGKSILSAITFGAKLLGIDLSLKSLGMTGKGAFEGIATGVQKALPAMAKLAGQFAAFYAVGETIQHIGFIFSDGAGEIREYADAAAAAVARLREFNDEKESGQGLGSVAATPKDLV
ncbi:MAG: tape measure protein, partial [Leptolyngbyaceae bacterium]|nr:tape measure protein [Leptolyngbyaceae bacterium]